MLEVRTEGRKERRKVSCGWGREFTALLVVVREREAISPFRLLQNGVILMITVNDNLVFWRGQFLCGLQTFEWHSGKNGNTPVTCGLL